METKLGVLLWSQAATGPSSRPPRGASTSSATTTCGPGTTCTRSSATRTSRSSRATRPSPRGRRSRPGRAWACSSARTRSATPASSRRSLTTIDHLSGGRAIAGIGGAWFDLEHAAAGIDFGSGFGQRLDWLDESVGAIAAAVRRRARDIARRAATTTSTTSSSCRRPSRRGCRSSSADRARRRPCGPSRRTPTCGTRWARSSSCATRWTCSSAHCDDVGPRPRRDRAHRRLQADHPRHRGRGRDGRLGGADGAQPDADGRGAGRRHVLGRHAGARSPSGWPSARRSGSTRSSPRWRRRTTRRRSSAGSARSDPWSTASHCAAAHCPARQPASRMAP